VTGAGAGAAGGVWASAWAPKKKTVRAAAVGSPRRPRVHAWVMFVAMGLLRFEASDQS
jgi:hypothetical protein